VTDSLFPDDFPIQPLIKARLEWEGMSDSIWWADACAALEKYVPPSLGLKITHEDRKWEVVSAYQKSVRRGDADLAVRLVSAMNSLPAEIPYFWKRLCTTAAEDVGPASREVMNFVMCASAIYTPKKAAEYQYKVMCFLTEMMCATPRSHDYCRVSCIKWYLDNAILPQNLSSEEQQVLMDIKDVEKTSGWAMKNNWRGEGMLKYQGITGFTAELILKGAGNARPAHHMLKGLPDYCYDMHTRVGKTLCIRLCGNKQIKEFFQKHPTQRKKDTIVGNAIFYLEGVCIEDDYSHPLIVGLEQKFEAAMNGWTLSAWNEFMQIVKGLFEDGTILSLRSQLVSEAPY
jgi:hypothetical protein